MMIELKKMLINTKQKWKKNRSEIETEKLSRKRQGEENSTKKKKKKKEKV